MIGVVHGRAVGDPIALADGEVIRDRDRLPVGDEEAVVGALERRPAAHARAGAGPHQIDRAVGAEIVPLAVGGKVPLLAAPAYLSRLRALPQEAAHPPGV